ncbi:MAG: DUF692 domain-containing protein, partial [Pseudomonadota bacterium]|nr:DUF692 domain-containing protein [Pseudomonadota bacterium]
HYEAALACRAEGMWFEVHAENYMVEGGPRLGWLEAIRERHPISLHGVSLSLATTAPPDAPTLAALARLVARIEPVLVSEHLAWSRFAGTSYPDLLPFPRTTEALDCIVANVGRVQDAIGRPIALENPSHYLPLVGHEWDEIGFLDEIARRSGCSLLLDLNNILVGSHNLGYDPVAYLDAFPAARVSEVHLAGHRADPGTDAALLIDSHDAPVAEAVWALHERFIARADARPTLIERDADLPAFAELMHERDRAHRAVACEAALLV